MMAAIPQLTAAQYRRIEADLPANRRDRLVISALLFRFNTGRSLRETSEIFGVSRVRLNEWERALTDALPVILCRLHLSPANPRQWSRGGHGLAQTAFRAA